MGEVTLRIWQAGDFDPQNIRRFCDVVMKGGVTSGVVYPLAICHLASKFILKNIGGTSVGAIAAAITAAAEYRRRTTGSGEGYVALSRLPQFLTRKGTLQTLFTADPRATLFLNAALKFTGSRHILIKSLLALIQFWWPTILLGIALYWALYGIFVLVSGPYHRVLFMQLHWGAGVLMLFGLIPATALLYVLACKWTLDRNDFGWAHGYHESDNARLRSISDATALTKAQTPRLIGWLDAFIQQAAGREKDAPPLTFGDLWNAPDPPWYTEHQTGIEYGIDFRMVTTCLTLGRPFEIPFDPTEPVGLNPDTGTDFDDAGHPRPDLYFKVEEMSRLFPARIVQHLVTHGEEHSRHPGYIRFPAAHAVPLVVAARLSMSFPILFCAVKFYATDTNDDMQPVWFSDGGLTSNFPIHFFDAPLPRWPTFAIDLLGSVPSKTNNEKYAEDAVFLESEHNPGTINPWNELGKGDGTAEGFIMAIIDTARTWLDETSATLPGNASRTIGVRLNPNEGGINLAMPADIVTSVMLRGQKAGELLLELFAAKSDTDPWQQQRWLRYRGAMSALTRWLIGYEIGYGGLKRNPQAKYEELIQKLYDRARAADAEFATQSIDELREAWETAPHHDPDFMRDEPQPFPVFAQRRPL